MDNTQRERLIEILNQDNCPSPYICDENCKYADLESCYEARTADLLLANGVIVLPCKVGDTVYHFSCYYGTILPYFVENCFYVFEANYNHENELLDKIDFEPDDIGKTVFLTREDAEQALKGGIE